MGLLLNNLIFASDEYWRTHTETYYSPKVTLKLAHRSAKTHTAPSRASKTKIQHKTHLILMGTIGSLLQERNWFYHRVTQLLCEKQISDWNRADPLQAIGAGFGLGFFFYFLFLFWRLPGVDQANHEEWWPHLLSSLEAKVVWNSLHEFPAEPWFVWKPSVLQLIFPWLLQHMPSIWFGLMLVTALVDGDFFWNFCTKRYHFRTQ